VQLSQGGQNTRRGQYAYKNLLERLIIKELLLLYRGEVLVIENDLFCYVEVPELKINLDYLRFAFGDFERITVNKFGIHVAYGENNNEL
jgi:hypothetical protein